MDRFKALMISRDEATGDRSVAIADLGPDDLMDGDVDIDVDFSTVNYKDGLAITGKAPVVRRFPMIPGIDLCGTVTASRHPAAAVGDRVIVNGWGIGETHYGGYAERARVSGGWLVPLPAGFTCAEAMAIGTAGYTAMLAVMALEPFGIGPEKGPVVVTGAAGGVGSLAVALLSDTGFAVHAVTGRPGEAHYLKDLGAAAIVDRAELTGPARPLAGERWAAGIDAVGGTVLANVLSMTMAGGAVAACGNAAGMDLPASVAPFILRGVSLVGVNSVTAPQAKRVEAWNRLARDLDRRKLAAMTTTIGLDDIVATAGDIVAGKVRGRTVVAIGQVAGRPPRQTAAGDDPVRRHRRTGGPATAP